MKADVIGSNGNPMTMLYLTDDGTKAVELKKSEVRALTEDFLSDGVKLVLTGGGSVTMSRKDFAEIGRSWDDEASEEEEAKEEKENKV